MWQCATSIRTTPHITVPRVKCGGGKLERAEFCTVGINGQWRNIYNSERYAWRSDVMAGGETTVGYGRAVRNRDVNFIPIPCFMKLNNVLLHKKYNHILTKPAPLPYCTQILSRKSA